MKKQHLFALIMIFSASSPAPAAEVGETQGQNFDRIVFDTPDDGEVMLTARVMTINRHKDSAAEITVTNNGAQVYGPERGDRERWTRTIPVRGSGRHEVTLRCQPLNAAPVYCGLSLDDARARIVE